MRNASTKSMVLTGFGLRSLTGVKTGVLPKRGDLIYFIVITLSFALFLVSIDLTRNTYASVRQNTLVRAGTGAFTSFISLFSERQAYNFQKDFKPSSSLGIK